MTKCKKYGYDLPEACDLICGYEDCQRHNLYKPTRFEQFREQTATMDGFIEWVLENGSCLSTCAYHERCKNGDEVDCKAGIKAYWEGEAT